MPADQRATASHAIAERVLSLPEWSAARTVALFKPIVKKGEVDTTPLDRAAREAGKRVAYPVIEGGDELLADCSMGFRFVDDPASFSDQGRGFPEPPRDGEPVTELDLVIVPALAFDPEGYRLGYGAGFYDRSLPRFPGSRTVGVAFDFQLLMELPRGEHDVPVEVVVTDRRVIRRHHE
jgi:5-formyltetrahydrofolate cyclo-ligase